MIDTDDVVGQLGISRHLLDDLARIAATLAKHGRVRPEVELVLASGHVVRGRIVTVDDGTAIVHAGGTSATFVRIDQVSAITVVDASVLVKAPTADVPVPSKLELMRQLAARGDSLGKRLELGGATELDDDGRRAIGFALPVVDEVVGAIAGDAMGREALAKVDAIELGSASAGEVRLEGRRLVIRAPKLLSEAFTHASLRKAIERLL